MMSTASSNTVQHPLRPSGISPTPLAGLVTDLDIQMDADTGALTVSDITLDSRQAGPGALYVGLPGTHTHGARFAVQAKEQGAQALLTDAEGAQIARDCGIAILQTPNPRSVMAHIAARLFGDPTQSMLMIGLTGTNGKTTTAFLVEAALAAAGRHVGTIGTIGFRLDQQPLPSVRGTITTPESSDLQALFAVMKERGADAVAMEVSSHALALERVEGVHFDVAGFTNLGRDHLDFHKTQEAYFEAKAKLFRPQTTAHAVINGDDPWGQILLRRAREAGAPHVVSSGFEPGSDYRVLSWDDNHDGGERVRMDAAGTIIEFDIVLPGRYNVANAATTVGILDLAGISLDDALPGLAHAQVPGRMQRVRLAGDSPHVYVDFAHTPQAVASALSAVHGRTIAVLGAGGDRDTAKREPMGTVAAEHADVVVVTDDNPRGEDPADIRAAVLAGARQVPGVEVIDGGDRRHAIALALSLAGPHDSVAILGKGHEKTQEIAGVLHPFDDVQVVHQAWSQHETEQTACGNQEAPDAR